MVKTSLRYTIALLFVFMLGFFLRFYRLSSIPPGLEIDELSMGYNAYALLETGKDEHGVSIPLYFQAFGEFKLPVYIYLSMLPIKLFGTTEFAIRSPAALAGFLTLVVFYQLLKLMLPEKNAIHLIAVFLLAINPWHVHFSRAAFETTIALFFVTCASFFFYRAVLHNSGSSLPTSMFFLIASMLTYNTYRLFAPLLTLYWGLKHKNPLISLLKEKHHLALLCLLLLILEGSIVIANLFLSGGLHSTQGTLIFTSSVTQARILEFRSYLIQLPEVFVKIFFNKYLLTGLEFLNNIANHLSGMFFFTTGSTHGNHGIGNVGQFYLFQLPLALIGIVHAYKQRQQLWASFFLSLASITILIASLTRESPYATRSILLVIPMTLFSAVGARFILRFVSDAKRQLLALGIVLSLFLFAGYNIIYYLTSYYVRFPLSYAKAWRNQDKALALYLKDQYKKFDHIIIDRHAGVVYTSLLYYQPFPPADFQSTAQYRAPDSEGYLEVERFGKYQIKDLSWEEDIRLPRTLIVAAGKNVPPHLTPVKVFAYPIQPAVFAVKQEILQYPFEEIAYTVISTENPNSRN